MIISGAFSNIHSCIHALEICATLQHAHRDTGTHQRHPDHPVLPGGYAVDMGIWKLKERQERMEFIFRNSRNRFKWLFLIGLIILIAARIFRMTAG